MRMSALLSLVAIVAAFCMSTRRAVVDSSLVTANLAGAESEVKQALESGADPNCILTEPSDFRNWLKLVVEGKKSQIVYQPLLTYTGCNAGVFHIRVATETTPTLPASSHALRHVRNASTQESHAQLAFTWS